MEFTYRHFKVKIEAEDLSGRDTNKEATEYLMDLLAYNIGQAATVARESGKTAAWRATEELFRALAERVEE